MFSYVIIYTMIGDDFMNFEEIIQRLRISLGAKIAAQKDMRKYYYLDGNEDYKTYKDTPTQKGT